MEGENINRINLANVGLSGEVPKLRAVENSAFDLGSFDVPSTSAGPSLTTNIEKGLKDMADAVRRTSELTTDINIDPYSGVQLNSGGLGSSVGLPRATSIFDSLPNDYLERARLVTVDDSSIQLNDGSFIPRFDDTGREDLSLGVDIEHTRGVQQSTVDKWANGLTKLGLKTANAIVGGTAGTVNGIIQGLKEGSFHSTYDNEFNDWLADANTKLDYKVLPNYTTIQERDMNLLQKAATANFWANDVAGGMSFMLGMLGSEAIWATATGGTSLGTIALRNGNKLAKAAQGIKNFNSLNTSLISKTLKGVKNGVDLRGMANTTRILGTSAGYESGMNAGQFLKEAKETFRSDYLKNYGILPPPEVEAEFETKAINSANAVFAGNMALVGASNLMQFPILNKLGNLANTTKLTNNILGRTIEKEGIEFALKNQNKFQKYAAITYDVAQRPFIEGVVEEGGQALMDKTGKLLLNAQYDMSTSNDTMGLMEAMYQGFKDTYGSKEGWNEIGVGMIIGALGGHVPGTGAKGDALGLQTNSRLRRQLEEQANLWNKELTPVVGDLANKFMAVQGNMMLSKDIEEADKTGRLVEAENMKLINFNQAMELAQNTKFDQDIKQHFSDVIDNMDQAQLREILGKDKVELTDIQTAKDEFNRMFDNRMSYVNSINSALFGTEEKDISLGINNINGEAINMTSRDFSNYIASIAMLGDNSEEVANYIAKSLQEYEGGLSVQKLKEEKLNDSERASLQKIKDYDVEIANLTERINTLQGEIVEEVVRPEDRDQLISNVEERRTNQDEIQKLQTQILALKNKERKERSKLIALTRLNKQPIPFEVNKQSSDSWDDATIDRALNYNKNLKDLEESLDPTSLEVINRLNTQFQYAVDSYKAYNELFKDLVKVDTRTVLMQNFAKNILGEEEVQARSLRDAIQEIHAKHIVRNLQREVPVIPPVQSTDEEDDITPEEVQTQSIEPKKDPLVSKSSPEIVPLRKRLRSLINQAVEKYGDVYKIKNEEIQEYSDLLDKFQKEFRSPERRLEGTDIDLTVLSNEQLQDQLYNTRKGDSFSQEEKERFIELQDKVTKAGNLIGTNIDGDNIGDLLDVVNQIDNQQLVDENDDNYEQEDSRLMEDITNSESLKNSSYTNPSVLQTFEGSYFSEVINGKVKELHISHLNPSTIINSLGAVDNITFQHPNKKQTPLRYDPNTNKLLRKNNNEELNPKEIGNYIVNKGADRITLSVDDFSARVKVKGNSKIDAFERNSNFIFRKTNDKATSYQPIIQNGNFVNSDFTITERGEVREVNTEELSRMKTGDSVTFHVSPINDFNRETWSNETLSKEDKENALVIYAKKNNQIVGVLKSGFKLNKSTQSDNLRKIRQMAYDKMTELETEGKLSDITSDISLGVEMKMKYLHIGNPNLNFDESGGVVLTNIEESDLNKIVDTGYMNPDGSLSLSKDLRNVDKSLVEKFTKKKGNKVPIAVFNENGTNFAYPIHINTGQTGALVEEFDKILNDTGITNREKVKRLNDFLENNNVDLDKYAFVNSRSVLNGLSDTHITEVREYLGGNKKVIPMSNLSNKNFNKESLVGVASTTLNLKDKLLFAPRGVYDMINVTVPFVKKEEKVEENLDPKTNKDVSNIQNESC